MSILNKNRLEEFDRRIGEQDKIIERLQARMQPEMKRTAIEVAKATIEFHEVCTKMWKIRLERLMYIARAKEIHEVDQVKDK